MKKIKKLLVGMMCVGVLCVTSIVPAFAETKDTSFDIYLNSYIGNHTAGRPKANKTPMYIYYTHGPLNKTRFSGWGGKSASTCYNNLTVGTSAELTRGLKRAMRTNIAENNYGYAGLGAHNGSNSGQRAKGVFSPDSAGNYYLIN